MADSNAVGIYSYYEMFRRLRSAKLELKELFPHIWERLLTIRILKEVFQADKEKVCTM